MAAAPLPPLETFSQVRLRFCASWAAFLTYSFLLSGSQAHLARSSCSRVCAARRDARTPRRLDCTDLAGRVGRLRSGAAILLCPGRRDRDGADSYARPVGHAAHVRGSCDRAGLLVLRQHPRLGGLDCRNFYEPWWRRGVVTGSARRDVVRPSYSSWPAGRAFASALLSSMTAETRRDKDHPRLFIDIALAAGDGLLRTLNLAYRLDLRPRALMAGCEELANKACHARSDIAREEESLSRARFLQKLFSASARSAIRSPVLSPRLLDRVFRLRGRARGGDPITAAGCSSIAHALLGQGAAVSACILICIATLSFCSPSTTPEDAELVAS